MTGMKGLYGADWSTARPEMVVLTRPRTVSHGGRSYSLPGGLRFCCRYVLDDARNEGKALHRDEALELSEAGVMICANFEYATRPRLTETQGAADARTALAELQRLGAPWWAPVYFSFDYDVQAGELPGLLRYMQAADEVLGPGLGGKRRAGAYGSLRVVDFLGPRGFPYLWQTFAWSRGVWSPWAAVRQVRNGAFPGEFDGDLNLAMADDIGAWSLITVVEETDMDMSTPTPPGGDTHGMTFGEVCGVAVRGANAAAAANRGIADLAAAFRMYITTDSAADASLTAKLDRIIAATADPAELAQAIAAALPADLARQVVHELGTAIELGAHPPQP